jgi:CRP/FNR family transcriptional regulator, cyclic AMP receptor protein
MPKASYLNAAVELSDLPILGLLSRDFLEELAEQVEMRHFQRNSYIFRPGDLNDSLCFLIKGCIKKGVFMPDGKELVQYLVRPKEYFGFDRLVGHFQRPHFTKSLTRSTVLFVPVHLIERMMSINGDFCAAILHLVANAVRRSETMLNVLLTGDVRTRILYFLEEHTQPLNDGDLPSDSLEHEGLTQQEIAQMIGATRQTVALVLNELRKEEKIDFNRRNIVLKSG